MIDGPPEGEDMGFPVTKIAGQYLGFLVTNLPQKRQHCSLSALLPVNTLALESHGSLLSPL